ncbi:hypothetical protein F1643_00460 [Azospirillum sp. INR13]|nr:hypothetical protein [Azospirillum sp. INR13]
MRTVIPANAGIHPKQALGSKTWIPAFAGMTVDHERFRLRWRAFDKTAFPIFTHLNHRRPRCTTP